jgi:hypothetical protein
MRKNTLLALALAGGLLQAPWLLPGVARADDDTTVTTTKKTVENDDGDRAVTHSKRVIESGDVDADADKRVVTKKTTKKQGDEEKIKTEKKIEDD